MLRTDLRTALAALPSKQRQAIELTFYYGLTTNEIALSLGESVGTIKSRLRLGIDRLRDAASAWWEGTEPAQPSSGCTGAYDRRCQC